MSTREFDDIVKQKAQRRQAVVPPGIWDNISNRKKKRRRPFFWLIFLALLIGSGVAVWKIKNSNSNVSVAATEKIKADKKNDDKENKTTSAAVENGNDNQSRVLNKIKSSDTNTNNTTVQPANDLNTNNNTAVEKRKALSSFSKTQSRTNVINTGGKEKTVLQKQYKGSTKGRYKTTIKNGDTGEFFDNVNTKNVVVENETKTGQPQKTNIGDLTVSNNSLLDIPVAITTITDNKKIDEPVADIADSPVIKKITQSDKKETAIKKTVAKQKSTSLKIEARATILFPAQQYKQPQTIQRILNTANATASFTSDKNILSTIESGNGFSISLIKKLNNKWSIGAGISHLRFTELVELPGSETNSEYRIVQRLKEGPNGAYLAPDTLSTNTTYNTTLFGRNIYHNTGIPLFARYRFIAGKKISGELTTGFTVNLLRKYSNNIPGEFTTVYVNGSKQSDRKNSIGLDVFAGLLVSGKLYRKYEWFATAEYAYNLSAYKTSSLSLNKKIHLPGVSFGVLYELRK